MLCMNPISISVKEASFYQQNIYLEITPCMNPALYQFRVHLFSKYTMYMYFEI